MDLLIDKVEGTEAEIVEPDPSWGSPITKGNSAIEF